VSAGSVGKRGTTKTLSVCAKVWCESENIYIEIKSLARKLVLKFIPSV